MAKDNTVLVLGGAALAVWLLTRNGQAPLPPEEDIGFPGITQGATIETVPILQSEAEMADIGFVGSTRATSPGHLHNLLVSVRNTSRDGSNTPVPMTFDIRFKVHEGAFAGKGSLLVNVAARIAFGPDQIIRVFSPKFLVTKPTGQEERDVVIEVNTTTGQRVIDQTWSPHFLVRTAMTSASIETTPILQQAAKTRQPLAGFFHRQATGRYLRR